MTDRDEGRPPGEDPARRLAADAAGLVREEVDQLRGEAATVLRRAGAGGVLLAGSTVFGALALHAGSLALLRSLESALPRRRAACVLAAGYVTVGGVLGAVGVARLREAGLVSRRTVAQVRRGVTSEQRT